MAVTSQQIVDFLLANPGMSDAQIVAAMEQYGVSPAQMATAVGLPEGEVVSRVAATIPEGMSVTLGDTRIAPQYEVRGSGEDRQVVGIENIYVEKTTGDVNYKAPVGSDVQVLSPTGDLVNTIKTKEDQSFFGGLVDAFKDPVVLAALGGAAAGGLLGGAGTAATVGTTGLTAAELAAYDLALGGAGGTAGATALGNALTTGAAIPTLTNLTGGSGATSGLLTTPAVTSAVAPTVAGTTAATTIPATTAATTAATALTPTATALTPAVTSTLSPLVKSAIPAITGALTSTPSSLTNLFSGGLGTAGSLLQMQQSKEAALAAQQRIDAETAAAKASSAFRPIGMTTRFGTSQFAVDPVTGQLTSAGYTLSPEAKNAQDRLVKLAESGLQQAEGAQQAFAPLQTGAERLFELGQGYLAKTPEQVASDYLKSQMDLLQPGRELELANLQNKLFQQGRSGVSVAQGGTYGATTPELQALFNARARQEAELAAGAQRAGQQDVLFGAGLLGQGSTALGNYYAGQTAAYSPYKTALGEVQNLETLGQQPLTMGIGLGEKAAAAGYNVGRLGLQGASQSVELATGRAATNNPYASAISGLTANPAFEKYLNSLFGGSIPTGSLTEGFSSNRVEQLEAGLPKDIFF